LRAAFINDTQQLADLDVVTFMARDARDDATPFGIDFEVDLFRLQLHERLTNLDAVAFLLEPLRNTSFHDRFAERWNDDVGHTTCFTWARAPDATTRAERVSKG
jgi:hypothetical protein